jgi:hypothetical protein
MAMTFSLMSSRVMYGPFAEMSNAWIHLKAAS